MRYAIVENNVCTNIIEARPEVAAEYESYRVSMDVSIGDSYNPALGAFLRTVPSYDVLTDDTGTIVTDKSGQPVYVAVGSTTMVMPILSAVNKDDSEDSAYGE